MRCRVFISGDRYVRFASTCTQSVTTLSNACQATRTVKLLVPSIELQAASHNSHRYILRALYPMPLFESQAVVKLQLYTQADVLFSRDPDPSSSVLYFPGLMQARRLRLHRHRCTDWTSWTRWSPSRCSQIIISRLEELHPGPGKKDCFFPEIWIHPGTPLCSSQVFSSGVHCSCCCHVLNLLFPGDLDPITLVPTR
jgi:hypothetical protein